MLANKAVSTQTLEDNDPTGQDEFRAASPLFAALESAIILLLPVELQARFRWLGNLSSSFVYEEALKSDIMAITDGTSGLETSVTRRLGPL